MNEQHLILMLVFIPLVAIFFAVAVILLIAYIRKKRRCNIIANAIVKKKLFARGAKLQYMHGDVSVEKNIYSDNRPSRYTIGQSVQVSYNPSNPTDMYISQYNSAKKILSIIFFVFGFFLIAIWILLILI